MINSYHQMTKHVYLPLRYHPSPAQDRRPHLRQHVRQRRSEDGGDHHFCSRGSCAGVYYAYGAKEEKEGAEAQKTQRWVVESGLCLLKNKRLQRIHTQYIMYKHIQIDLHTILLL